MCGHRSPCRRVVEDMATLLVVEVHCVFQINNRSLTHADHSLSGTAKISDNRHHRRECEYQYEERKRAQPKSSLLMASVSQCPAGKEAQRLVMLRKPWPQSRLRHSVLKRTNLAATTNVLDSHRSRGIGNWPLNHRPCPPTMTEPLHARSQSSLE